MVKQTLSVKEPKKKKDVGSSSVQIKKQKGGLLNLMFNTNRGFDAFYSKIKTEIPQILKLGEEKGRQIAIDKWKGLS